MTQLLRNIHSSYQAYFLDILTMENDNYEHMTYIMEENCERQEKYYESLIDSSKCLDVFKSYHNSKIKKLLGYTYGAQIARQSNGYITEILREWNRNKLIISGLTGCVDNYCPVLTIGFQGKMDSKMSNWARVVTSKVKGFFQPIIRETLDSFVIFYRTSETREVSSELTVTYPGDLNVNGCQIEYVVPQISNPVYASILQASKDFIFAHSNDLVNCVRETIIKLYKVMQEIEQWMLNYPPWPKTCDGNTLRGLVNISRRSIICSMLVSVQIDACSALREGLGRSVKSVIVEPSHNVYMQNTQQLCAKLQNAIMAQLSNGDKLVDVVSQATEHCKLA